MNTELIIFFVVLAVLGIPLVFKLFGVATKSWREFRSEVPYSDLGPDSGASTDWSSVGHSAHDASHDAGGDHSHH